MAEAISVARPPRKDEGVFMTALNVGADLAEQGLMGTLGIARTLRGEVFHATQGAVDWAQAVEQMPFKVVRDAVQRADKLTLAALDGAEAVALAFLRLVRGSGHAAGEIVTRTTESLVGATKQAATHAA